MDKNKQSRTYRLSDTALTYLDEYSEKHNMNKTESLEKIIREHKASSEDEIEKIANTVVEQIEDKYKNLFTRLRLATGYTEKNVQILIEMMNSLFFAMNVQEDFYDTDKFESIVLEKSRVFVQGRIDKAKQRKDSKFAKK